MVPKRRILFDSLLSVSIALGLLLIAEMGLRILYPEKVLEIAEEHRRIESLAYRFQPEYLVALNPNVNKIFERSAANGGEVVNWKTNRASFRGPQLRSQQELRVIVYGDSNIQARFSHLDQTFPYKLQEYLTSLSEMDVEVINGGVVGSGPDQVLMRFSSEVDTYSPDIVIFHVFTDNDLGDLVRNRLYDLDAEGALVRTNFRPKADISLKSNSSRLLITSAALKVLRIIAGGDAGAHSVEMPSQEIPSLEQEVTDYLALADEEYAVYREGKPRLFSHFADHYDFDVALHPDGESATTKMALLERILERAKTIADEKDVELIVLIQPSSRDMTENLSINYRDLQQYPSYLKDRLTSIVDSICSRHEIPRVNLYSVFSKNNAQSLFFKGGDDHWNDTGQELAAREMADHIYSNILRPRRSSIGPLGVEENQLSISPAVEPTL